MSESDLTTLEALVKVEHWGEFKNWHKELLELFADHRAMHRRLSEMAVERLDAVTIAYHDGAKDMRDRCAKALAGSYDAGAANTIRALSLPERIISIL